MEIFRFIVFLVFFFTNLTCAILPIYAMKISEKMSVQGLSPAMLAAVPISAEVLSGAIFSALGGKVIHKLGAKRSVFVMLCTAYSRTWVASGSQYMAAYFKLPCFLEQAGEYCFYLSIL